MDVKHVAKHTASTGGNPRPTYHKLVVCPIGATRSITGYWPDVRAMAGRSNPFGELAHLQSDQPPTPPGSRRTRSLRSGWGRGRRGAGQAGVAAFGLALTGSKSTDHDSKSARHRLQRLVHPTVQLDLVVQRAKDVGDGALFGKWGKCDRKSTNRWKIQSLRHFPSPCPWMCRTIAGELSQ